MVATKFGAREGGGGETERGREAKSWVTLAEISVGGKTEVHREKEYQAPTEGGRREGGTPNATSCGFSTGPSLFCQTDAYDIRLHVSSSCIIHETTRPFRCLTLMLKVVG